MAQLRQMQISLGTGRGAGGRKALHEVGPVLLRAFWIGFGGKKLGEKGTKAGQGCWKEGWL